MGGSSLMAHLKRGLMSADCSAAPRYERSDSDITACSECSEEVSDSGTLSDDLAPEQLIEKMEGTRQSSKFQALSSIRRSYLTDSMSGVGSCRPSRRHSVHTVTHRRSGSGDTLSPDARHHVEESLSSESVYLLSSTSGPNLAADADQALAPPEVLNRPSSNPSAHLLPIVEQS